MANLHLLAKGGLVVLIVISLAVLIERLTNAGKSSNISDFGIQVLEINSTATPDIGIMSKMLEECLTKHTESPYFPISFYKNVTASCFLPPGPCMYQMIIDFSTLMESFGIKLLLIEPSLLFCLLPSSRKYNVLTRGFNSRKVQGLGNVMSFGMLPSEAKILDDTHVRLKLIKAGYRIFRFPNQIKSGIVSESEVESVHHLIIQNDIVMHLTIFYQRKSYLWSPSFNSSEINVNTLQYTNNSAFEEFTVSPEHLTTLSAAKIYIPSDARCFLIDSLSSNFLECKTNSSAGSANSNGEMALNKLKKVLASQMVIFWLWSKSLQGWLEKCDVLHYSSQLNIAIAAKSVEGYNFSALFANSECQHIDNFSNLGTIVKIEVKCYGLSINVYLMYEDKDAYWYEHFDGQNTYKLFFPKFSLCSTEVFGLKTNVPCETSELLDSKYGQFLKNVTLHLDPQRMENVVLEY